MAASPGKATTTTRLKRPPVSSTPPENTQYALVPKGESWRTAEWMTFVQATEFFRSPSLPRGAKLYAKCLVCAEVFTRPLSKFLGNTQARERQEHTCSTACRAQLRSLRTSVNQVCDECGEEFSEPASVAAKPRKNTFCSNACRGKHRARTYVGENNHRYAQQEVTCECCGKVFRRKQSAVDRARAAGERLFCSRECYAESLRGAPTNRSRPSRGARSYPPEFKKARAAMLATQTPCVVCGAVAKDLHHRDGDKENNESGNLVPVCRSCHSAHHHPSSSGLPELMPL